MSLVSTDWLMANLDKVKIIDCSWHMPQTKRNGFEEYKKQHIKNAIYFDLDKNSKKDTDLPHMLIDKKSWENIVSNMGIKNDDQIIVYDNSDVISSDTTPSNLSLLLASITKNSFVKIFSLIWALFFTNSIFSLAE